MWFVKQLQRAKVEFESDKSDKVSKRSHLILLAERRISIYMMRASLTFG